MEKRKLAIVSLIVILLIIIFGISIFILINTNFEKGINNGEPIYGEQVEYYTNAPGEAVGNNEIASQGINFKCESGEIIEIVEGDYTIEVKVIGEENNLCEVFATLTRAPGFEALLIGSNATCFLTQSEINNLSNDTDISKLNCEGVLYELAKAR